MEYITRSIEQAFREASKSYKVVLAAGAEEIGKLTMMRHLSKGERRICIPMDDLHPQTLAETDPDLFFEIFKPPVIIDSVHLTPSILYKIKEICEQSEENGQFWLTCVPKASFISEVKQIFADKVAIFEMQGLSMREKSGRLTADPLHFSYEEMLIRAQSAPKSSLSATFRQIWRGGMPGVNDIPQEDKPKFFWHYFYESLMEQVKQSKKVKLPTDFSDFLSVCAMNISKVLSVESLARVIGISHDAALSWLQLMIDMGVI